MRKVAMSALLALVLVVLVQPVLAQHGPAIPAGETAALAASAAHGTHPDLSPDARWTVIMLAIIGVMFLAAALIGPIMRSAASEDLSAPHSHDEPANASHHGGTLPNAGHH